MTTTYESTSKQAATNGVVDELDGGSIEICAGATVLAVLALGTPAFGAANASGVATANAIAADESANATGTADNAKVRKSGGALAFTVDVRATADPDNGEECVLDDTGIEAGDRVAITSFTVQVI